MPDSFDHTPEPRLVACPERSRRVDNSEAFDRARDIFMRTIDVAPDPDGEHIWLLLKPKGE